MSFAAWIAFSKQTASHRLWISVTSPQQASTVRYVSSNTVLQSAGVRVAHLSLSRTVGIPRYSTVRDWFRRIGMRSTFVSEATTYSFLDSKSPGLCGAPHIFRVTNCRIPWYSTIRDWLRRIGMRSVLLFQKLLLSFLDSKSSGLCAAPHIFRVTNCRIPWYSTVRDWFRRIGMRSVLLFQKLLLVVS